MPNGHILAHTQVGHLWPSKGIYGATRGTLGCGWEMRAVRSPLPVITIPVKIGSAR
jgi:hypothetical protein